jgi:long-chain acyl-CoA synthetase
VINLYRRTAYLGQSLPGVVAVETAKERLTYGALDELARRIATSLRSAGVAPGDLVGVRMNDTPAHVAALLATMRLGATILPMDFRATRAEFDRVTGRFSPRVVLNDENPTIDWSPAIIDIAAAAACAPDDGAVADPPDGVFALSLTSGTTGQPKAVMVTHGQVYARCTTRALEGMFASDDRFLTTLPLAYPAGREHALAPLLLGATLVMFPTLFFPAELVEFINASHVTAFNLSPNMSRALLARAPTQDGPMLPNVRTMVSTTGKLDPQERAQLRKRIVRQVIDYYGSTGTGPIAVTRAETDTGEESAAGRLAIGIEAEIVDEAGALVAGGAAGRIRVRGPAVTTATAGTSEEADEGFRDGWYYPGDLGRFDEYGVLHLLGRSADLIKRGGLMVYAQEVEQVLRRYCGVMDAAVVGVPSAELGQEVAAFIETENDLDRREVTRFCRRHLSGYKVPTRIEVVDALPRNAGGKVVKGRLLKPSS